jgi:hypothetical protein
LIDGVFEPPRPTQLSVEQGWRIGGTAVDKRVGADPDQSKSRAAVRFCGKHSSGGVIQRVG